MDIFDLDMKEFEKKIDELLENMTDEELLKELVDNGLVIDEYDNEPYYIEDELNNEWVHIDRTSNNKHKRKIFSKINKRKINLVEAA